MSLMPVRNGCEKNFLVCVGSFHKTKEKSAGHNLPSGGTGMPTTYKKSPRLSVGILLLIPWSLKLPVFQTRLKANASNYFYEESQYYKINRIIITPDLPSLFCTILYIYLY